MIFLAKVGMAMAGAVLVGGAAISGEGFIHVKVHEIEPNGTNINVMVPAALVNAGLGFVPNHCLADAARNLRPYLPVVDAAIPALEDSPDGTLVLVHDANDHVLVAKRAGSLVVDVEDREETVHVSVPLRAALRSIHSIAEASETNP